MAGISTSITMRDKMTNVLNRQIGALDKMTRSCIAADAASERLGGNSLGTLSGWRGRIGNARGELDRYIQRQEQARVGAEKVGSAWSGVGGMIKTAVAAFGAKQALSLTLGGGLDLDTMEREFQARLGSDAMGSALFAKLQKQAQTSAFSLSDLAKNTSSFLAMTTDPKQLDGLNKIAEQLAVFDKTGQGLAGAGFSLKEAMSGDIVSLAERFNMSKAQIRAFGIDQMGKNGDVDGFIKQFNALLEAQNMGEEAYQKMLAAPKTQLNMFLSNLKTGFATASQEAITALAPLIMTLNEWFSSSAGQQFFAGVGLIISWVVQGVIWLTDMIGRLCTFVQQNWSIIQPILIGVGAALLLWGATLIPGLIVKLWGMVAPTLAIAAGWALAHLPVLLMIGLIALLAYNLASMGVTFSDVCSFIGTLLGGLYAFGYNLVADAYNLLATFAEFFANVFNDPVGAVARLFFGVFDSILGIVETVAGAIDALLGSNMAGAVSGFRSDMQKWVDDKFGENQIKIDRMEKIDTGDTAKAWGEKGVAFADGLGGLAAGLSTDGLSGLFSNGISSVDKVGEVGKINDEVNIAEEDLKFLRDVAEMRYIQNFVTLTPTVAMNASISEKVDVNVVVAEIERKLEEEFAAEAEGVYA